MLRCLRRLCGTCPARLRRCSRLCGSLPPRSATRRLPRRAARWSCSGGGSMRRMRACSVTHLLTCSWAPACLRCGCRVVGSAGHGTVHQRLGGLSVAQAGGDGGRCREVPNCRLVVALLTCGCRTTASPPRASRCWPAARALSRMAWSTGAAQPSPSCIAGCNWGARLGWARAPCDPARPAAALGGGSGLPSLLTPSLPPPLLSSLLPSPREGDFLFVGPTVFDQLEDAQQDVQLPEYLANSRFHKARHTQRRHACLAAGAAACDHPC